VSIPSRPAEVRLTSGLGMKYPPWRSERPAAGGVSGAASRFDALWSMCNLCKLDRLLGPLRVPYLALVRGNRVAAPMVSGMV
jgi:hypothetical protein